MLKIEALFCLSATKDTENKNVAAVRFYRRKDVLEWECFSKKHRKALNK